MTTWQNVLKEAKSIGILGFSSKPWRASYGVAKYLKDSGYRVYLINPNLNSPIWDISIHKNLSEIDAVDVINIFRKTEYLSQVVDEIRNLPWTPKMCWFQMNMVLEPSDESRLADKDILVVKDKCLMVEHRLME